MEILAKPTVTSPSTSSLKATPSLSETSFLPVAIFSRWSRILHGASCQILQAVVLNGWYSRFYSPQSLERLAWRPGQQPTPRESLLFSSFRAAMSLLLLGRGQMRSAMEMHKKELSRSRAWIFYATSMSSPCFSCRSWFDTHICSFQFLFILKPWHRISNTASHQPWLLH